MSNGITGLVLELAAKDAAWPVLPILMADMMSGEIIYTSIMAAGTFGYEVPELLGQPIELLVPEDLHDAHRRWRQDASVPRTRLMGVGRHIRGRKKDGTIFPVMVVLTAMTALEKQIGIALVIDLTGVVATATLPVV